MWECIGVTRFSDVAMISGVTGGSWIFGYVMGAPLRRPTAATAATIGVTAGFLLAYQNTMQRLMGYSENDRELKMHGMEPNTKK